ncbi:MAG: hypothetical protein HY343_10780 [Lentisphaerae bacterium]|nr:hypothetical protein [Lentisphaerota bacterium]
MEQKTDMRAEAGAAPSRHGGRAAAWAATVALGCLSVIGGGCAGLRSPDAGGRPYLGFVRDTVDRHILSNQTARLGGQSNGPLFVTISRTPMRAWTSVGMWDKDHFQLYDIPEVKIERAPTCADFAAWGMLDRLSRLAGDPRYARLADAMAAAFAHDGFEAASGLLLVGSQSHFDVVGRKTAGLRAPDEKPEFKPLSNLPLDRLWALAPEAMARFSRAAYYGLVTRPATMDYNRFCDYGFDDRQKQHVTPFNPQHRGFVYSGAMLIQYWLMDYTRTGDTQCLAWARSMAAKWTALQHPESGLLPHFIGAIRTDDPRQSPAPYANAMDTQTAVMFLQAARMLDGHPEAKDLAAQLNGLGRRSLKGLCRYAYDAKSRLWLDWVSLDGSPYTGDPQYGFRSEAEKDEAIKRDPKVVKVGVYPGSSDYRIADYMRQAFGSASVVLEGAALTRDSELISEARRFATLALDEARKRRSPVNAIGQWGFSATGRLVSGLLDLHAATGDRHYLEQARELADIELRLLTARPDAAALRDAAPEAADWWRFMLRSQFLDALLRLEEACRSI